MAQSRGMLLRTGAAVIVSTLLACASHEGPSSTIYTPEISPSALIVAVASVQLNQDCPDPPAPTAVAQEESPGAMMPGASMEMGPGGGSMPCAQSTVQLSVTNEGAMPGKLQILSIRLLDAASGRELGTLVGRGPSLWNDATGYQAWDERIDPGATLKVSYKLADPDWAQVQAHLEPGTNLFARPFILEIQLKGQTGTVRSSEFVREDLSQIVT